MPDPGRWAPPVSGVGSSSGLEPLLARSVPRPPGARRGDDLEPLDWRSAGNVLVESARAQRLTGALASAIEAGDVEMLDPQCEQLLRHHSDALAACLRLEDRLCEIVDSLQAAGIHEHRVIKGSAIAHLDESDPSMRTFGDVDLLVRPHDLDAVEQVVRALGGVRPYPERRAGFDRRFAKSVTYTFPDGLELDVHRTICDGVHGVRVPLERLWSAPDTFTAGGVQLSAMGHTARLLHSAYHLVLGSPEPRLFNRRDLLGYLTMTDQRVDEVAAEATRWQGTAVLVEGVSSVLALPEVALPGWEAWAARTVVTGSERSIVEAQRRDGSSYGPSRLRMLRELPSWDDRAAFALGVLAPSRAHLESRGLGRGSLLRRAVRR